MTLINALQIVAKQKSFVFFLCMPSISIAMRRRKTRTEQKKVMKSLTPPRLLSMALVHPGNMLRKSKLLSRALFLYCTTQCEEKRKKITH